MSALRLILELDGWFLESLQGIRIVTWPNGWLKDFLLNLWLFTTEPDSEFFLAFWFTACTQHKPRHALGIWICRCIPFYIRELLAWKSADAHSTKSLKIVRCKRWCPKDLRVRAPSATVPMHFLQTDIFCQTCVSRNRNFVEEMFSWHITWQA